MSYKGLPFVTVWIEYSEIGTVLKPTGAKPLRRRDGSYAYTVPTLRDPNTGSLITDSIEIASYPEKPIFPAQTTQKDSFVPLTLPTMTC